MLSPITLSFLTVSIIPSVTEPNIERVAMPVRSLNRNVAYIADCAAINVQFFLVHVNVKYIYAIMQLFVQTLTKVKHKLFT